MNDSRTFKKGELVILHDGGNGRNAIELARVGEDCSYASSEVLISYGAFNTPYPKHSVHKLPPTLKKIFTKPNAS